MVVSRSGARLEYDCAGSTIDQPIVVDGKGRFTAKGSYRPESGGPRRSGQSDGRPVRYAGQLNGDTMRLTVTPEGSRLPLGVFGLTRGTDPLLTKCR
jgi:hypothetical protein